MKGPWTCFHCDETFTSAACASAHFGNDEDQRPACRIKGSEGGLLRALRDAEADARRAWGIIHSESADGLKARWATIQFNAFLQEKMGTQVLPGGNTDEIYCVDGVKREKGQRYAEGATTEKSDMLVREHPDVARASHRFKRAHHTVDYGRFRGLALRRRADVEVEPGVDNYGMSLRVLPAAEPA